MSKRENKSYDCVSYSKLNFPHTDCKEQGGEGSVSILPHSIQMRFLDSHHNLCVGNVAHDIPFRLSKVVYSFILEDKIIMQTVV